MSGYHIKKIKKGKYGKPSKIREELEELEDALEQHNKIMALCELADIYGALAALAGNLGVTMSDLKVHSDATARAFEDGTRVESTKEKNNDDD